MTTIRDFLPSSFVSEDHVNLKALIDALITGDTSTVDILSQAREQFFLSSAQGRYLVNLANQYGFAIPANSGIDLEGFRDLAIPAIWAPKQSIPTINKIAELFYSTAVLHPVVLSERTESYSLADGDTLVFETDTGTVSVLFEASGFDDITDLSASQIASTINIQSQGQLFADTILDRETGLNRVRVVSLTFGSAAKIRVLGGDAQNEVRFADTYASGNTAGTVWDIEKFSSAGYSNTVRFTWDGVGSNPELFRLQVGDYVNIEKLVDGAAEFSKLNGFYRLVDVGYDYFVISNTQFTETGVSYTQDFDDQFVFTAQKFFTLFDNEAYAVVSETSPGQIDVTVPAVPPVTRATLRGATRLRGAVENLVEFRQSQLVVPFPNQFPASGTVIIDSAQFDEGFNRRFIRYSSKDSPSGGAQALNVDSASINQVPFLTPSEAEVSLSSIPDLNPIFVSVFDEDIQIETDAVPHYFENGQEIAIAGAAVGIDLLRYKAVPSILCPVGQDSQTFEHDMNSDKLYMQFYAEDTNELLHFVYQPDSATDPENRTKFFYAPELEGRFVRAVMVEVSDGLPPSDFTASVAPITANPAGDTAVITHNFGTPFSTFVMLDSADNHNVVGTRVVDQPNDVDFTYDVPAGISAFRSLHVDYEAVFPTVQRAVAQNVTLQASQSSFLLVHNLFTTNVIAEIRVTDPGTTTYEQDSLINFPEIVIIDDTSLEIRYSNFSSDIVVDIFLIPVFFNPIESLHGGLLPSQINSEHIVRRRRDEDSYSIEIYGTGEAPFGSGQITTSGKTVTGVGTQFLSEAAAGNFIYLVEIGQKRLVDSVDSDTEITLEQPFNPSVSTPTSYKIVSPEANDTEVGVPVQYEGAVIFGFNVTFNPDPVRGTDIRFEFPDRVARQNARFIDGTRVNLVPSEGFDTQGTVAEYLKGIPLTVHSQDLNYVFFRADIGATPGIIIQGAKCRRSGFLGGSDFKHYLPQPLSQRNQDNWFKDAQVLLLDNNIVDNEAYKGSYLYDIEGTDSPFVISAISTPLTESVDKLSAPGELSVGSAADFPEDGFIFVDFGNTEFEGPIRYRFRELGTPNKLILDPSYIFKRTHSDNAIVRLAASVNKIELSGNASELPVYLTGVVEARKTFERVVTDLVSVGVKLNLDIQLPELRFSEPSLQPFE